MTGDDRRMLALFVVVALWLAAFAIGAARASAGTPFCDLRDACHSIMPDTHPGLEDAVDALRGQEGGHHEGGGNDHAGRDHSDHSTNLEQLPTRELDGDFCQRPRGERHYWRHGGAVYWHDHVAGRTTRTRLAGPVELWRRAFCTGRLDTSAILGVWR